MALASLESCLVRDATPPANNLINEGCHTSKKIVICNADLSYRTTILTRGKKYDVIWRVGGLLSQHITPTGALAPWWEKRSLANLLPET